MIISNNQILNLIRQYQKQDKVLDVNKEKANSRVKNDEAKVAEDAKAFQMAKELIKDLPEIREDRLANVQRLVKGGTYEITDDEIAEKMIGRTLVDKLV